MILHVLPGDAYVDTFRETGLEGDLAIFRECLIEGDLSGNTLSEFWATRESYLSTAYPQNGNSYKQNVAAEIEKLLTPGEGDEINLWFEYELFCSVNYWFCLDLLRNSKAEIYRVAPTVRDEETKWKGFGNLTSHRMLACYNDGLKVTAEDSRRGSALWQAFKSGRLDNVRQLGSYDSPVFPQLREVTDAAEELDSRPRRILQRIRSAGKDDFDEIFEEFSTQAGVYGFGDSQLRKIIAEVEAGQK